MLRDYWQRLTSSPAHVQWLVLLGGGAAVTMLLLMLGLVVAGAASMGEDEEAASPPKSKAASTKSAESDESPAPAPEKTVEKKPKPPPPPEPHTPEERIPYILKKELQEGKSTTVEVEPWPKEPGCLMATVNYKTPFVGSNLAGEPPLYYEAIYTDPELRSEICLVRTNAYGSSTDDYGNKKKVRLLTTSMDRETAEKINWQNSGSVNFAKLYKTEFLHPSARADMQREAARKAVDCLEDQGMFDFDEFEC